MPKYRVTGSKEIIYYTDVTASDTFEAVDIANELPTNEWFEMENDDVIEAFEAEKIEEDFQQELEFYEEQKIQLNIGGYPIYNICKL